MVHDTDEADGAKAVHFVGRALALVRDETFGNPFTAMLANFERSDAFEASASAGHPAWRCTWRLPEDVELCLN
jgi:hypothetical protein